MVTWVAITFLSAQTSLSFSSDLALYQFPPTELLHCSQNLKCLDPRCSNSEHCCGPSHGDHVFPILMLKVNINWSSWLICMTLCFVLLSHDWLTDSLLNTSMIIQVNLTGQNYVGPVLDRSSSYIFTESMFLRCESLHVPQYVLNSSAGIPHLVPLFPR